MGWAFASIKLLKLGGGELVYTFSPVLRSDAAAIDGVGEQQAQGGRGNGMVRVVYVLVTTPSIN